MSEKLVSCETILKSCKRTKKGVILTFEITPDDFTATMAVLPLDEPMTLELHSMDVGI